MDMKKKGQRKIKTEAFIILEKGIHQSEVVHFLGIEKKVLDSLRKEYTSKRLFSLYIGIMMAMIEISKLGHH